ncbi:PLP-dependent transferase, partial [Acidobacteriota bacterium]
MTDDDMRPGVKRYVEEGQKILADRAERIRRAKGYRFDTIAVHGLYSVEEMIENNQGSIIEPMYLSSSQAYRDSDEMEAALAYLIPTWCYSRIANPTMYYLEWVLALMEGYGFDEETSCCATASGMSAIASATAPFLARKGSEPLNFVSTCQVYGGTFQQFGVRRMQEQGIDCRWVIDSTNISDWEKQIDENTRFLYGEVPSNPGLAFFDIEEVAELAHAHDIPLILDTTVATPALIRPFLHGADIVI